MAILAVDSVDCRSRGGYFPSLCIKKRMGSNTILVVIGTQAPSFLYAFALGGRISLVRKQITWWIPCRMQRLMPQEVPPSFS